MKFDAQVTQASCGQLSESGFHSTFDKPASLTETSPGSGEFQLQIFENDTAMTTYYVQALGDPSTQMGLYLGYGGGDPPPPPLTFQPAAPLP